MKFLSIAVAVMFLVFAASADAVDTRGIEEVRAKKVLNDADLQVIDDFVAQAVNEVLTTRDFSSISGIRSIIVASSTSSQSDQVQYAQQFSESARNHIAAALRQADTLTSDNRGFMITTNLLMLINDLTDPGLADMVFGYIDSNNDVIRYWAVHCLTDPEMLEKLDASQRAGIVRRIISRLAPVIETSDAETLGLIVTFIGSARIPESEDLLLKIADRRIVSYADWSVKYELLDGTVLQMLTKQMLSDNPDKEAVAGRFGQLLSYVFERYIKGADVLSFAQKEQLASVLVDTERLCLNKLTGKPSAAIKTAVESGDLNALLALHNDLLGDPVKPGILPEKMNFDYGKAVDGSPLTVPLPLENPPTS